MEARERTVEVDDPLSRHDALEVLARSCAEVFSVRLRYEVRH